MKIKAFIYSLLLFFIYSCNKDGSPVYEMDGSVTNDGSVYILNEGTFGQSNASIDRYDMSDLTVERGVFQKKNGSSPGDVVLSMTADDDEFYVVVNNSGSIHICDSEMQKKSTISGFRSPRFLQKISSTTAYVTNFLLSTGNNEIDVVDLLQQSIVGKINVSGWCEQVMLIDDHVYVLNPGADKMLKIDISSHEIVSEQVLSRQPLSMQLDQNNMLWVLSTGGFNEQIPALTQLDPSSLEIVKTLEFNSLDDFPSWLCTNAAKDSLFYINNGIYALSINDNNLPNEALIQNNMTYMYAMSLDPTSNTLFVSDGKDFQRQGEISHFKTTGELINQFECGVGPGNFYFHK